MITIGGSARVTATGGSSAAGIGGGRYYAGGMITIGGSARVAAQGGSAGAGIGGGHFGAGGTIDISGSAQIAATGGTDSAGIGGADGVDSVDGAFTAGAKITIGTGSDYPVVIAKGGTTTNSSGNADSACGIGTGGTSRASTVEIEINSGFVLAQSNRPNGQGIGINPASDSGSSYVKISGGSVYATNTYTGSANNIVSPAPTNGSVAVFPLYVSGALADSKTVSVPGSPAYTAKTLGKSAARFLITGIFTAAPDQFPAAAVDASLLTGLFPTAISATLWLPENSSYSGVTVDGAGNYHANVQPAITGYTQKLTTNRLVE
jgi:hypothetical protein